MTHESAVTNLERSLAAALTEIDELRSREDIRECIHRVSRGIDRIDADLLRSAFHPGATIDYGKLFQGAVEDWIASAIKHQAGQTQRHHLIGQIAIRIDGDGAVAESYGTDRHVSPMGGAVHDLVLASRTLDRLERRDGVWAIVARKKVLDWGRAISADSGIYDNSALETGADDRTDASYQLLG